LSMLPVFLKLDGRNCLLVGAGTVALDKIGSLLATGVKLRVVAPEARAEIRDLARENKLEWVERCFETSDLDGNFLVIAATNDAEVNAAVYRGSVERNILSNSVDDIPNCDFFFGSLVTRGNLQIAISTSGESPAVAQRLRREIDAQLPEDLGSWLEQLGQLRREVLSIHPPSEERKQLLHQLAQLPLCASSQCPSRQLARASLPSAGGSDSEVRHLLAAPVLASSGHFPDGLSSTPGVVSLVGAGPGTPDLLTVQALGLIQAAEVILHDDLIRAEVLELATPEAEIVNVGKRCGTKTITQEEINELMIHHARARRRVVRLKSGDPLLFGRAAEEIAALTSAGIALHIVPGITAASAAAAALGCSLTDRNRASNVTFSTGHHAQSHNHAPLPEIEDTTRVVYMPGRDLGLLAAEWLDQGLPPDFPCAVISNVATANHQVRYATLRDLGALEPTPAPSLLIAGWTLSSVAEAFQSEADTSSRQGIHSQLMTG
jgi:uroporphyrin-III C-methyltransferase / precorrin-2 dehydrogenase / sirohydrochlorin ferrochelatase